MIRGIRASEEKLINEVYRIIKKANENGIVLRVLGGLAIYIHSDHSPRCRYLHKTLGRLDETCTFTDVDLIAYKRQIKDVKNFFEKTLNYMPDPYVNTLFGNKRLIYHHPEKMFSADIFFDKLEFSHDITFKDRLEIDFPTISPTDLVLEKLQIHEINRKDVIDLLVLFLGHEISETNGNSAISANYIANVLAEDWGFYYDAIHNLKTLKQFTSELTLENKLTGEEQNLLIERIDELMRIIEEMPKTKNWLKRAKVGTSKPWYRKVEEIVR
ncbi:MAG: hypothetical protein ACPLZF_07085 [Nitrososphaeria archaeon]